MPRPPDLAFDAGTHTYRYGVRVVPSVTQALQVVSEFGHVNPEILATARQFGQHVHQATDLFDRGGLDEDSLDIELVPYLNAWKLFLAETGFVVTHSEARIYHPRMRYAGTLDRRGTWKGTTWLLDLKSGAVPRSVGAQTAAYQKACDEPPKRRVCLQLKRNAYQLHRCEDPSDFALFTSCLNIWNHLHGHKSSRCIAA
jgi:hypothetical protein